MAPESPVVNGGGVTNGNNSSNETVFVSSSQTFARTGTVQQFPKHDTVKLTETTYILWKQQVLLIVDGYGLSSYISDKTVVPNQFVTAAGARSSAKISSLRHSLHSQKKGCLSISEFLAKIRLICDTLSAAGSVISEQEQVSVVLAGLSVEFESVIAIASREVVVASQSASSASFPADKSASFVSQVQETSDQSYVRNNRGANSYRGSYQGQSHDNSQGQNHDNSFSTDQKQQGSVGNTQRVQRSETPMQTYNHVVAPSGNNSTALFSPASQQVFSSVVPSSAVAGGYNNFAPLMVSVGVPTASISPQASIPSAPVSASFSPQSSAAFVPSSSTSVSVIPGETTWYPDSGATHHITMTHPTFTQVLFTENMLHVPAIRKNLLSVSQLARENNVYFEFHPHGCCVKDVQSRATLLEGILTPEGLYKLGSRQDKVNTNIPLVTQNTSNVDNLVSDVFRVSNNQLSSQQRNDLVEAISSTENGSGSGVDEREFLEHGDGLNRDCLEQGVGLDALLEAEDTALPAETCELNSGDGFDVLPAETLDVLPAETCGFSNEDCQNDCSEESSRLSRVATVSENVSMRDSLARGDTEQPLADDDDVVSADKRTRFKDIDKVGCGVYDIIVSMLIGLLPAGSSFFLEKEVARGMLQSID
ncbi:hypothetical protein GQ457_15G015170 [Hibiscus cannabinus]